MKTEEKKEILGQIENQTFEATQKTLAQKFNLPAKHPEKKRFQRDETIRAELTFTKEEMEDLERVKELLSHIKPGGKLSDVISYLTKDFLKRRDSLRKPRPVEAAQSSVQALESEEKSIQGKNRKPDAVATNPIIHLRNTRSESNLEILPQKTRSESDLSHERQKSESVQLRSARISVRVKRSVFQRTQGCQWRDPRTGRVCGSRFQVQVDHKQSRWAGGGDELENLQVLCSAHNRFKYKKESHQL